MSAEALQQAFFREMDKLRRGPKRIEPLDLAEVTRKVGLPPHEAVLQIRKCTPLGPQGSGDMFDALAMFLCHLCEHGNVSRALEYTTVPSVLTARLAERNKVKSLSYVAPYEHVAEVLRVLFGATAVSIVRGTTELKKHAGFDVIICAPPLGHRPEGQSHADGFGGELVRQLVALLATGGTLYWVTGRGAVFNTRAKQTLADLRKLGLSAVATIEVAPGIFPNTMIEAVVIGLRRESTTKRFVGALRDLETAEPLASAFLRGPSRKEGASWAWLDAEDQRTFAVLAHARLLHNLKPRGRHTAETLGSLLLRPAIKKADTPVSDEDRAATFLFVPEYAGSRVTADLEEQTVRPGAVYRLPVDPAKANPRFLARLLNSPYGRQVRADASRGMTIQRVAAPELLSLKLPIPDRPTQDRIARIDGDIGLLQATFRDMQDTLDRDWARVLEVGEQIDALKGVLDIERQIADWWRELPYPLATIYRRYHVSQSPRERLDTLLHFFEMAAVYLATVGTSHVKSLRKDWQEVMAKWLHPSGAAGIERADFGFWIGLASVSLKDANRIGSDAELRTSAFEIAGPELVQVASTIGSLGKATEVLDVARRYRNSKVHGGSLKPSDAARLDRELQQAVRDLYEMTASVFRHFELVRPSV